MHDDLYNTYLTTDMSEYTLISKLDCMQYKSVKKNGVIYTPIEIVNKMISITSPTPHMTIIEPTCGHGTFLFALLEYMQHTHSLHGMELYNWFIDKVVAIDISDNTVDELKEILILYFYKHFNISVPVFDNICIADSLFYPHPYTFDLCIGNPPYVRTKNLDPVYLTTLRNTFASCKKGNVDIYYAFIEKYSMAANQLCFITPNSFLVNVSAKTLRELIINRITVLIDFKDTLMFKDARTYTCIFNIDTGITTVVSYSTDLSSTPVLVDKSKIFNLHTTNKNSKLIVMSGIATLCDSVFKIKKINNLFYANLDGVQYQIEKSLVIPFLKLTKIKNNNLTNIDYILYPYDNQRLIISEIELQNNYPMAYAYLLLTKTKLEKRDKGKTSKYESWYAYGRKQGLHTIVEQDLIIIPGMIGNECKPSIINIAAILQEFGKLVFTSGFVIPYSSDTNEFLSDRFLEFVKECGKPWPGNYHSITTKQIKSFTLT